MNQILTVHRSEKRCILQKGEGEGVQKSAIRNPKSKSLAPCYVFIFLIPHSAFPLPHSKAPEP